MPKTKEKESLKYESQFSIYKVDYEQSCDYFINEKQIAIETYEELVEEIIEEIKHNINKRPKSKIEPINHFGFKGLLFKTHHSPTWKSIVPVLRNDKNISDESIIKDVENVHISYILLYKKENNIFILTAGLGSNYIGEFTQKNYGLYLLPKIINENSAVIRAVALNNLIGNKVSSVYANRNVTDIGTEKDMSSVFKELALEINKEVIELLGMEAGEKKRDKILTINARDSFVIRKSLPIEKIKKVLDQLIKIEERKDKFPMGYLIKAQKYKYPIQELNETLLDNIVSRSSTGIIIQYDNYYNYYVCGERYILKNSEDEIVIDQTEPIKFEDIYIKFPQMTKRKAEQILKYKLEVFGTGLKQSGELQLKKCIQAIVEDEFGKSFFLYNGNWLTFDKTYIQNLNDDYKKIYKEIMINAEDIACKIKNKDKKETEDDYNKSFENSDEIIVAHTVEISNVEIADLIYYDKDNLYLIHNKTKFQGSGARDVFNQILLSADYLTKDSNKKGLHEYYTKIKDKYPNNKKMQELNEEEFVSLFDKKIHYVAGFMNNLSENSRSNSAKYMVINSHKAMISKNCNLHLFSIN